MLIVGGRSAGKTLCLHEVADRTGAQVVNLGLEMSRRLLELSPRERPLRVSQLFRQTALGRSGKTPEPVLLDNIEILSSADLRQNPLELLRSLARDRPVVATWPGSIRGNTIRYAAPGHPEYRTWPACVIQHVLLDPSPKSHTR